MVAIITAIPRPHCFRYEPSWSPLPNFYTLITGIWSQPAPRSGANPDQAFVAKLKCCRQECKKWHKQLRPCAQRKQDCRAVIVALDLLEEERRMTGPERTLRQLVSDELHLTIREAALY